SPTPTVSREVVIVTSVLIFTLGVIGNGFICLGFCRFRQLRSLTNYFVLNLAVADLLLVAALAGWIIHDIRGNPPDEKILISLLINIDVLCFSASMLNMMAISLDRYCAVTYPLQYPHIITESRAHIATFLIWAYSLAMAGIGVSRFFTDAMENSDKIFVTVLSTVNFLIPAVVMVLTHLSILRIAWNAKHRSMVDLGGIEGVHNMMELISSLKLSFNTFVILVPMVTAWGIFYGVTVLETLWPIHIQLSAGFSITVGLLPHIAAAVDPIVYILVTCDLRRKLCHF
ncbi:histamine H2 receptor-like, partial [Stylophora pistillata]|uniref:histamine H2 receptor-like n=1 Tax=Stylophora pistillata TaxID=50429 RepID=UPI000C041AE8